MNTNNDEMSNVSNDNNIGSSNIDSINHISNNLCHIGSADNISNAIISAQHFNSANNLLDSENENHNDHIGLKNVLITNKNMNNYSSLSNENTIDDNGNDMNFLNDDDNDNCNESNDNNHSGNTGVTIEIATDSGNNDCMNNDKAQANDMHNNVADEQNGGNDASENGHIGNDIASSSVNNTGTTLTMEDAQLNSDKKSAPNGNYKNAFFKNVDDVRSFERGILYLTDEEFNYISNTVNLLGFRFFEIPSEKSKSEKRNTYSAISKRHLNEIKNLRCSLSNNIYDAGKRKSKKSFDRYYSKDETSSTTTKDNNDTQREITRRRGTAYSNYEDDNKSSLNDDDNKYGNISNNHVNNGTASLGSSAYRGGGAYNNKVGSSSGSGVNTKISENDKIGQGRNNSMVKKGFISKGEMDSGNVNKNTYGAFPSVGKGKSSKSVGSSSSKNNAAMHHSNYKNGATGAAAAVAGGKEALKKRQRSSNNSILEDDTVDEYEQHKRTYKKRIYKSGNPWKNWCFKILHKLKKKEICCWFLKPVNPELDGIPNYFNVIKNPMDFETIENKLLTNKYNNPFEWQQDVRQIFFNAFTYHKVKNCVWNDAYKLAKEFDKLVKQHTEMKNILNECTKGSNSVYLDMNKYNEILAEKYEYDENLNHSSSSSYTGSSSEEISSDEYHSNKRYNRNNSASNAYTVRKKNMMMPGGGVAAGNHAAYHNMDPSNHMYGAPNRKGSAAAGDSRFNKMNKQMSSMSSKNARDKFVNNKKDNCYGVGNNNSSSGNIHMNSNNNSIEFEPPSMGTIPEPPGIQKIGANDKGLNNYQVNLLFKNLRRLAPNQRRAALEIIQDDLGILAENHMFDRFFTFDTDLLSIEKQKRIFLYINHMGRINLEQYKASLIPSDQIGACTMPKGKMPMKNMNNKNYLNSTNSLGNNNNNSNNLHFDKRRTNRYLSSSSNSSDSSSSNSSDSSTYSTSSEDSESEEDSDSDMDSDAYDKKKVKRQLSSNERKKEVITNKYFDNNRRKTLPQYKPIDENKKNLQLRDDVMGMHADFLASMDGPKNGKNDPKSSGSAWPEWKGQVIQQAILTQHQSSVPLNKKELIAEGYDAKI